MDERFDFVTWAETMRSGMMRRAMSILYSWEDSADAVQEAMLHCWQKRDSLRDSQKANAWLMKCLFNECMNIKRSRRRNWILQDRLTHEVVAWPDSPPGIDIEEALETLPQIDHQCIRLYYCEGYPLTEVAEMMRISYNALRSRMFYARAKVRDACAKASA